MERIKKVTTREEIKIISDPYRLDIIEAFRKADQPSTAKQVAEILGEKPSKVNYHVHRLHEFGFLELKFTRSINGIIAKYYEVAFDELRVENTSKAPGVYSETERMVMGILDDFKEIMRKRFKTAASDDHKGELIYSTIELTEEEFNDAVNYIQEMTKHQSEGATRYKFLAALTPDIEE